jgi:hypothetical protein
MSISINNCNTYKKCVELEKSILSLHPSISGGNLRNRLITVPEYHLFIEGSRYSSGLRPGPPMKLGSIPGRGKSYSSSSQRPDRHGIHPASEPVNCGGSFSWIKRPRREAENSLPSNPELNNMWIFTSTPPLHRHCLVPDYWAQGKHCKYIEASIICK